jgi:hypothetical protein
MAFEITRMDVWASELFDRPGALAEKLQGVMRAGADLDFMIARRQPDKPGTSVLFLAPLTSLDQIRAAEDGGFKKAAGLHSIRLIGPDRPGLAAGIAKTVADAGLNIRGLSAAAVNDRCVFYVAFESDEAALKAIQVLTRELG